MRRNDHPTARVLMVLALLVGMLGMVGGSTAIAETGQQPRVQTDALALQAGRTDLAIRISSSDPDVANRLGNPTSIRLSQGGATRFTGNITNTPTLPRVFNINPSGGTTFPQGTYLLTINAGSQFDVFSQNVTLNQTTQTLNVTLQVDDAFQELIDDLIEILIQILRDILAMTPTAVPSTATATAVPSTATATTTTGPGTSTATAVPATNTPVPPTATATATQPPAAVSNLTVDANPNSLVTGQSSTVTVTVTGRSGPVGGRLVVTPTGEAGLTLRTFTCQGCSSQNQTTGVTEFTYGPNMAFTARLTFQASSTTADDYTISVTARDSVSGRNLTTEEVVTFLAPTPTATATATATATSTATATATLVPPVTVGPLSCTDADDVDEVTGCTLASGQTVTGGAASCDGNQDVPGTCEADVAGFGTVEFETCGTTTGTDPDTLDCQAEMVRPT